MLWPLRFRAGVSWSRYKVSKFSGAVLPQKYCTALNLQTWCFVQRSDLLIPFASFCAFHCASKVRLPETPLILAGALGGPH